MPMQERFLVSVDLGGVPQLTPRVLIVGSGVAGLSAALAAADAGHEVLVATKGPVRESNTYYAQGGVAVAMGEDDSPQLHERDTLEAGCGLCDEEAVKVLVREGIDRCKELIDWGTPFDRSGDGIAFTMEGAHGARRVIHASGDSTGKAITETLARRTREHENIKLLENHFVVDLLHFEGECYGALLLDTTYGRMLRVEAGATIVATGGLGRIYRETTNPEVATGDGYALCFRAGATLRDMEFVQFHPTTLYLPGAPRFLISEAVRGEGAHLLNLKGERFMPKYSPDGELASRDVVSQSIFQEINATGTTHVHLDMRHLGEELIERRFPTIRQLCADYGIDVVTDPIPVRPSVHYMMGGVKTDLHAATEVRRLYAAGEVACTGVHGANRLASNSLLEGLVFGYRAGVSASALNGEGGRFPPRTIARHLASRAVPLDVEDVVRSLKALTWRHLGVYRDGNMLEEALANIARWEKYVLPEQFQARAGFEIQNMLTTAKAMAKAALLRCESRGAHQRTDYPNLSQAWGERHVDLTVRDFAE